MILTHARLVELLNYDPTTGVFTWRKKPSRRVVVGTIAGHVRPGDGYFVIMIARKVHYGHRLAWFYMTGAEPSYEVDHIDTIRTNNRFANLRLADSFPNQQNMRKPTKRNRSGALGVSAIGRGYRATVRHAGKNHYSRTFASVDEAYVEYVAMKRKLHAGCTL